MAHQLTVNSPLPSGVVAVTLPNPVGGPGIPAAAGQVVILPDTAFCYIPNYWFSTANSFGVAVLTDDGVIAGS